MPRLPAVLACILAAGSAAADPATPPSAAPLAEDEILVVDEKDLPRMWREIGEQGKQLELGAPMRGEDRFELGCVSVGFVVEADGRVRTAQVLRSEPPRKLDAAGLRTARALRFEPGPDNEARLPVYSIRTWSVGRADVKDVVAAMAPCMVDIEVPPPGPAPVDGR